jgi:hypothetical protein
MYLLRGYSRMLADAEDVARRVICCTDRSRHDRMQLHHLVDVVELELITVNVAASRLVESGLGDVHSIEVGPLAPTIVVGARAAVLTGC